MQSTQTCRSRPTRTLRRADKNADDHAHTGKTASNAQGPYSIVAALSERRQLLGEQLLHIRKRLELKRIS